MCLQFSRLNGHLIQRHSCLMWHICIYLLMSVYHRRKFHLSVDWMVTERWLNGDWMVTGKVDFSRISVTIQRFRNAIAVLSDSIYYVLRVCHYMLWVCYYMLWFRHYMLWICYYMLWFRHYVLWVYRYMLRVCYYMMWVCYYMLWGFFIICCDFVIIRFFFFDSFSLLW